MNALNKTAIITGASSGIGAELARKFSKEGYDLLLIARNSERLEKVKAETSNHSKVEILSLDLKEVLKNKSLIEDKLKKLSPLEVLVNNAGVFTYDQIENTTEDIWTEQFQTNLLSVVMLTQIVWPYFVKNKKGSVVNISSTLGIKPTATTQAYSAIKAALVNWTTSLAQEGGAHNIRVNCICPGIVATPIHGKTDLNQLTSLNLIEKVGSPENIAEATYFLASDLSNWTTGSVLSVDGGINIK